MKFQIYRDRKKEWRWRLVARNGRKVANSGEGYRRRAACFEAVNKFLIDGADAAIRLHKAEISSAVKDKKNYPWGDKWTTPKRSR